MVKFGKNKLKTLNKLAKKQNASPTSNKTIKKKLNAEKKISFQKEILLKQAFKSDALVKTTKRPLDTSKEVEQPKPKEVNKKIKAVEKQKKRQKMQITDTKLLLSLMKKK